MTGSSGVDQSEVGRRLRRAARVAFGAMLTVAAIGCAGSGATVSSTPTFTGGPSSGTPVTTSSSSPQRASPTAAQTPQPPPTPTSNGNRTTVFWVFAHPDDETISSAGAMYESQQAGNRNVLILVTDGETTRIGLSLGLSLKQVAAAREKEATAALAVIGIVPVFLREPETGGGVQLGFVEQSIGKLASQTKGTVVFEGLGPNDAYLGLPHGDSDHYTVARALLA